MSVVKSIVRWFFGFQALVLILIPVVAIIGNLTTHRGTHAGYVASRHLHPAPLAMTGFFILGALPLVAVVAVFAMAWWTTRKTSAKRNLWAIAASILYLAEGIVGFVYVRRYGPSHFGLDLIAVGGAGLLVFLRCENVPDPAIAGSKRTPIAGDRTSVWTRHAVTALSSIAQIAALFVWGIWAHTHHLFRTRGFTWIALVTVGSILTTIVHECGHAILAWCFEMGLVSFKAGPFQWAKREGKWKFRFHAAGLLTPGGAVGAIPTNPDQPAWEEILVIAAGPAANLLLGIPAIWAVMHDSWASYQHTWEFIAFTGSFSLIAAVLNLFPFMSEDGAYSDGARVLQIVTHSPLDDYHRTQASIASTLITARRPRDLDIAAIERAASLFPQEFRGLWLRLCVCEIYEDSSRFPEASAALAAAESIYNNFSIDLPAQLHTVFVIGHAYLNRDAVAARLWWDRMEVKKEARSNVDYWLAKTALNWIEGSLKDAEGAWQEANVAAQSLPRFGAYEFDRLRCALLRQVLDDPLQAPALASTPIAAGTPAFAALTISALSSPGRPAVTITPTALALSTVAAPASSLLLDPFARIISDPVTPTPSPIPANLAATERLPFAIDSLSAPGSLGIAPGVSSPFSEISPLPSDSTVVRRPASFTRIPASSMVSPEAPFSRISLLAIATPTADIPALASSATAPASKAKAVPAAFARRPVRPVPAPPSSPYAVPAVDAALTSHEMQILLVPVLQRSVIPAQTDPFLVAPTPVEAQVPAATSNSSRFDPLEFIRAAAMENLST